MDAPAAGAAAGAAGVAVPEAAGLGANKLAAAEAAPCVPGAEDAAASAGLAGCAKPLRNTPPAVPVAGVDAPVAGLGASAGFTPRLKSEVVGAGVAAAEASAGLGG